MNDILTSNKPKFIGVFNKITAITFFIFIFLVLSFGRAFSILHIGYIFITEIFIFFYLFFIAFNLKKILIIPRNLLIPLILYFIFGCVYLLKSIFEGNVCGLRDIVFVDYIMLFPVTFLIFRNKKRLKIFLVILILSNIINLAMARLCLYRAVPWMPLHEFFSEIRAFNYALYYGISISFLIPLFDFVNKKRYKITIVLFGIFNIYIILIWGVRSAWLALFAMFLFMVFVFGKKAFKFLFPVFLTFFIIFFVSTYFFNTDLEHFKKDILGGKIASLGQFFKKAAVNTETIEMKTGETRIRVSQGKFIDKSKYLDQKEEKKSDVSQPSVEYVTFSRNIGWRIERWKGSMRYSMESPFFGRGFGVFSIRATSHWRNVLGARSMSVPAHNHIISIFLKMGLIGLGLFLFVNIYSFLYAFIYLCESKSNFTRFFLTGCLGSLIFWHVLALTFNVIDSPPTSIFSWIIMGLIFACVEADKRILVQQKNEE